MKAKISLLVAVGIGALAVAVPAALAEGRLAGSNEPADAVGWFFANEATTAGQNGNAVSSYPDAFERAKPPLAQLSAPATLSSPTASDDGTSIAWAQIGISFLVGLLLALGVMLAVRARPRQVLPQ